MSKINLNNFEDMSISGGYIHVKRTKPLPSEFWGSRPFKKRKKRYSY